MGRCNTYLGRRFDSMGINPVSLAISGDTLLVANRNEDPAQLHALRGAANSSYVSFRIRSHGWLEFVSATELTDGHKSTQVLVSSRNDRMRFGNDFQVDADFDGDGSVSKLFGNEAAVRGRINGFLGIRLSGTDLSSSTSKRSPKLSIQCRTCRACRLVFGITPNRTCSTSGS